MTQDVGVAPGTLIAERYRIDGLIARGGMGAVHEATDMRLGRTVALKVLRPELTRERTLIARFEREAKLAAQLAHPGIAQVLDFGATNEGLLYLVMERIQGVTLGALLTREGRLAPLRAAELVEQALGTLAAAHQVGIVHRDLKPGNMMVLATGESREVVKLLDFGIAHIKASEAYARLTQTGEILGTPTYMAPEQAMGEAVDARTDVYAMGIVLWCLLTSQKPFGARDMADMVEALLHIVPERADRIAPEVPSALAAIADKAMQKDPRARFQSASEMARALVEFRGRAASSVPLQHRTVRLESPMFVGPVIAPQAPATPSRRRNILWGAAIVTLGVMGIAGLIAVVMAFYAVTANSPVADATQTLTLEPDFTPNPTTVNVVAGGPVLAEQIPGDAYCTGHIPTAPSIRLTTAVPVRRVLVSTRGLGDTTMLIRLSDGRVVCDDMSGQDGNAELRVDFPVGTHDIFIGVYEGVQTSPTAVDFALGGVEKELPPPECAELATCCEAASDGHPEDCVMWRHPDAAQAQSCAQFLADCLHQAEAREGRGGDTHGEHATTVDTTQSGGRLQVDREVF